MSFKNFDLFGTAQTELPAAAEQTTAPAVVLIDDDVDLGAALQLSLGQLYRVSVHCQAAAGIEAVNDETSAVLLDIKMPGMDGFSAYEKIKEKDADVPIIFHSAYQDLKDPYKIIKEYRPFGCLTKGTELTGLLRMLGDAVVQRERSSRRRNIQRELASVKTQMEALRKRISLSR